MRKTYFAKNYYVTEDGRAFCDKGGAPKELLSNTYKSKYIMITYRENGKKHIEYLHRLVAKAFVENPNHYNIVRHKDENNFNNKASNLEWCNHKTIINNVYEKKAHYECEICGRKGIIKDQNQKTICGYCKRLEKEKIITKKKKIERRRKRFNNLIPKTQREEDVLEKLYKGFTYKEIGESLGITKQRVYQIIDRLVKEREEQRRE